MTLQWNPSTVTPFVQSGFRIQVGGDEAPGTYFDLNVATISGVADEQEAFDLMLSLRAWLIDNVNPYVRVFTTISGSATLVDI